MTEEQLTEMIRVSSPATLLDAMFRLNQVYLSVLYVDGDDGTETEVNLGLDAVMRVYAEDAVETAKAQFGVVLDYGEDSVGKVDALLMQIHQARPKRLLGKLFGRGVDDPELQEASRRWAGYVGQVAHRFSDATWGAAKDRTTGQSHVVVLRGEEVVPFAQVAAERIANGRGETMTDAYHRILRAEG